METRYEVLLLLDIRVGGRDGLGVDFYLETGLGKGEGERGG